LGYYGYHLWFLGFLLFFSLVSLPVISYLKGNNGQRLTDRLAGIAERRGGLLLIYLPFALLQLVTMWLWPGYQSWGNTTFWGAFFILGYLFYSNPRFQAVLVRDRKFWWSAALASVGVLVVLAILGLLGISRLVDAAQLNPEAIKAALANPGEAIAKANLILPLLLGYVGVLTAYNYNAWALALAVMAIGIGRLNYTDRKLEVAEPFSMPFYVFHHPFIVIFGFYVVQLSIGGIPQFLLLGTTALAATIAVVALLIAPWNPLRAVFGMRKPGAGKKSAPL
jgi:glucans biosynthesis protein C